MTNQLQIHRSSVAGARPTGRAPGELAINWPDKQLSVIDAANQPLDLVAVRYFSVDANYPIGSFVVEAGQLWRSIVDVTAAPFDPAQWVSVSSAVDLSAYLPLAGGTMTGPLTLAADAAASLQAVTYQQLAAYAEWAGGEFTGVVAAPGFVVENTPPGASNIVGTVGGEIRWQVSLANGEAETGANAGSNFGIYSYDDTGALLGNPLIINRATGQAIFAEPLMVTSIAAGRGGALTLEGVPGTNRVIEATSNPGGLRWGIMLASAGVESGGDAGSDFQIFSYTDVGVFKDAPLQINRSSGVAAFSQPIVNGSDRRLKENIIPITGALDKITALQGVTYTTFNNDKPHVGLIAQDTQPVLPEVVFETGQPMDAEGKELPGDPILGVAYGNIVAVLIEAVKELSAKVDELEAAA